MYSTTIVSGSMFHIDGGVVVLFLCFFLLLHLTGTIDAPEIILVLVFIELYISKSIITSNIINCLLVIECGNLAVLCDTYSITMLFASLINCSPLITSSKRDGN